MMTLIVILIFGAVAAVCCAGLVMVRHKQMHLWLPHYLRRGFGLNRSNEGLTHVMFCFTDHYEPQWGGVDDIEVERARVDRWLNEYPKKFGHIKDFDGCFPKHSYFYPEEEYREEHLNKIADLCSQGFGEIEVHIHHEDDTSENLTKTLLDFTQVLHNKHGAFVPCPSTGHWAYGFIHGNWTLDNSHPDGLHCGVQDELLVLKNSGCYADFTLPSAPSPAQTTTVNSIYYATDDPELPKSHDKGIDVEVGVSASGDLMMIQGPLSLDWTRRKFGLMPRIENGDVRTANPPYKHRVDAWINQHIHVKGKPDWLFVKVYTHGTQERDMDTLLGSPTVEMYEYLASKYNDGERYAMHFVSAREMYNIVKAAEAGEIGNPGDYRDYVLGRPANCSPDFVAYPPSE